MKALSTQANACRNSRQAGRVAMTSMLHRLTDNVFDHRIQLAELDYFTSSDEGLRAIARNYVGLPYQEIR